MLMKKRVLMASRPYRQQPPPQKNGIIFKEITGPLRTVFMCKNKKIY